MKAEKIIEVKITKQDSPLYGKTAIFMAENFEYNEKENDIYFDNMTLYVNDQSFEINVVTFSGHKLDYNDAALQTIDAYLRNDQEYEFIYMHPVIEKLRNSQKLIQVKTQLMKYKTFHQFYPYPQIFDTTCIDNIESQYCFAEDTEGYLLLDKYNTILTTMEPFYMSALCDDVNDGSTFLYESPEFIKYKDTLKD